MRLRCAGALAATLLLSRSADAVPYEVFIEVRSEEDLYDLLLTQQISKRSFDSLLLLFQTKVNLSRAGREELYLLPNLEYDDVDRILAHRSDAGVLETLDDLVVAGALPERLARSLLSFVTTRQTKSRKTSTYGFVRAQLRWSGRYDRYPPATALQARVRAAPGLDAGAVLTLTRNSLGRPRWDGTRHGLSVGPESRRLVVPKAYAEWEAPAWELVVGTYRIGFGQRLTFDATDQVTPNGPFDDYELRRVNELTRRCRRSIGELDRSPCPTRRVARVTPDFAWTHRLAGVAAGLRHKEVGPGWLQAYIWGSFQPHRVQSRDIAIASNCPDPRSDDDPSCDAPRVYVRNGADRGQAIATNASLAMAAAEPLAGVNLGYFWNPRTNVMLTAYGATTRWLVRGASLDYQEIAKTPFGGRFGAVGLSAAYGSGRHDLFVEVARSFDQQAGGGGGSGVVVRSVTDVRDGELDLSLRAYGKRFANPYARPIAAPDELDGLRARDEIGARARLVRRFHPRIAVRTLVDFWRRIQRSAPKALAFARLDVELNDLWLGSVWAEYRSSGKRTVLATRLAVDAFREVSLSLQLQHRWHASTTAHRQRDVAAVFAVAGRPVEPLAIRFRFRYDLEDVFDNHSLPHTAWLYIECALKVRVRDTLRLRYDLRVFLDERDSTSVRVPNPEHWSWLEYVLRY